MSEKSKSGSQEHPTVLHESGVPHVPEDDGADEIMNLLRQRSEETALCSESELHLQEALDNEAHETEAEDPWQLQAELTTLEPLQAPLPERFTASPSSTPAPSSVPISLPVDVAFIGCGPVGLWTAVSLKLRLPETRIIMFEKHSSYQRSHVVQLHQRSLWGRPKSPELDALVHGFPYSVRTLKIETDLQTLALKLGIDLQVKNITSLDDIAASCGGRLPGFIIGSDGSHSFVRDKLMQHQHHPPLMVSATLRRTCNIRYEISGTPVKLSSSDLYCLSKLIPNHGHFSLFEHIGKPTAEGLSTPATLTVVGLNEEDFDSVCQGSFKCPMRLPGDTPKLTAAVKAAIHSYFALKRARGETQVAGSITLAGVKLDVYRSHNFVEAWHVPDHLSALHAISVLEKTAPTGSVELNDNLLSVLTELERKRKKGTSHGSPTFTLGLQSSFQGSGNETLEEKAEGDSNAPSPSSASSSLSTNPADLPLSVSTYTLVLVGDAAFGVPYFRALNNGMISGTRLAAVLESALKTTEPAKHLTNYKAFMEYLSHGEIARARSKNGGLSVGNGFRGLMSRMPKALQLVKLSSEEDKAVTKAIQSGLAF